MKMKVYRFNLPGASFPLAVLAGLCIFNSCQNNRQNGDTGLSPETEAALLVSECIKQTGSLVPSSNLNEYFFKRYGVPSRLQRQFTETYEHLRADLEKVQRIHQPRESVRYFLLNRILSHSEDSLAGFEKIRCLALPGNPVYMAFALMAENKPEWSEIGNPNYIKTLGRSFGVKETEVTEGIWLLLRNEPLPVFEAVAQMIQVNLDHTENEPPSFFFRNILVPYLTYISRGRSVYSPVEERIFSEYQKIFIDGNNRNELKAFTGAFKRYMTGDALNVRYLNALNASLERHRLRLFVSSRTAIGYEILAYGIPIRRQGIGDVVFLRKTSICLSMAYLGLSTINDKNVIVNFDDISEYADDIMYTLETGKPLFSLSAVAKTIWRELNTGLSLDSAELLFTALINREFGGQSHSDIVNRLVKQIAVHEVKHKWDEVTKASEGWYNVDCETSAHLTEAIYGGNPIYSLLSIIFRYQHFYENIDREDVCDALKLWIRRYWKIAQDVADETMDEGRLINELRGAFSEYTCIDGGVLPPLETFEKDVFRPCLDSLPVFSDIAYSQF